MTISPGSEVKRRRLAAGLTQEQLAERAGIARQTVQLIEYGDNSHSTATLERVAAALDCTVVDLLTGSDLPAAIND